MRSQLRYGPKFAPIITPPKTNVKQKVSAGMVLPFWAKLW